VGKFPAPFERVLSAWNRNHHVSICTLEQQELGVTHDRLGAYLLDWWNLPAGLVEACLYHHDPLNESVYHPAILALVNLVDSASWRMIRYVDELPPPQSPLYTIAGISRESLEIELAKERERLPSAG
jgi:HD-like signal output (HDOD) protein